MLGVFRVRRERQPDSENGETARQRDGKMARQRYSGYRDEEARMPDRQ